MRDADDRSVRVALLDISQPRMRRSTSSTPQASGEVHPFPHRQRQRSSSSGQRHLVARPGVITKSGFTYRVEAAVAQASIVIRDVTVIDGTGAPPREHADIVLRSGRHTLVLAKHYDG